MRAVFGGAIVASLSILATPGSSVQAVDYDFVSVYSSATPLAELNATAPSVNNAGTVAFAALIPDPAANRSTYVVFRSAGGQLVALLNLTDSLGAGSPGPLVINDSGAIALHYARGIEGMVVRIQPDGSYVVLARSDQFASTPYLEIAPTVSMNGTGQVAALVTNTDLTSSIVRFDAAGAVEVARSSPDLVNFSPPAINDAGVVAFTAQGASAGNVHVYSGTGRLADRRGRDRPVPRAEPHARHQQRRPRAQRLRWSAALLGSRRRGQRPARGQRRPDLRPPDLGLRPEQSRPGGVRHRIGRGAARGRALHRQRPAERQGRCGPATPCSSCPSRTSRSAIAPSTTPARSRFSSRSAASARPPTSSWPPRGGRRRRSPSRIWPARSSAARRCR